MISYFFSDSTLILLYQFLVIVHVHVFYFSTQRVGISNARENMQTDVRVVLFYNIWVQHVGHVTWTMYTNFRSPFPFRFHIKFGFDWPSGFLEKDL